MEFKDRLRYLIENVKVNNKDVSTYRIGKETPISRVSYANYMSGKQVPTIDKAIIIAQYFDISINWLLLGEGVPKEICDSELLTHLKEELRIVREENKSLYREIGRLEEQLKEVKKDAPEESNVKCAIASGSDLQE